LGEITEELFNAWKHHPVTRFYLRYLSDYARDGHLYLAALVRGANTTPDPFLMGRLAGHANGVGDAGAVQYATIVDFYTPLKDMEEQNAA
jgi:hypothetical protein